MRRKHQSIRVFSGHGCVCNSIRWTIQFLAAFKETRGGQEVAKKEGMKPCI